MGCDISGVMANALKPITERSVDNHRMLTNFRYHKMVEAGKPLDITSSQHSQLQVAQSHVQLGFQRWRALSLFGPPLPAFYFYVNNTLKREFANKAQNHSGTGCH